MKKFVLFAACGLMLASCSKDTDLYQGDQAAIEQNVKNVLGESFDINQDYNMLTTGEVKITADVEPSVGFKAGDFEVAKVQILSANPFYETDVVVLNEIKAKQGDVVTLNFDAPNNLTELYAAVVSKDNRYRVKAFQIGDESVSFGGTAAKAPRRTRGTVDVPTVIGDGEQSRNAYFLSENSKNANSYKMWAGSHWNDKCFDISTTIDTLDNFTSAEANEVNGVINRFTPETVDNRSSIKQSEFYINTSNYFTTVQTPKPIYVSFVHSGASVIDSERLYYYYYNPADVAGMSDEQRAEFLQQLPKYRALNCVDTRDAGTRVGGWQFTKRAFRTKLAYFGDEVPTDGTTGTYDFPSGYKIGFMLYVTYGPTVNLYADTLLNNEVNFYEKWASAKMGKNESRAAIFGANGKNYVGFEDWADNDFNDVVFQVEGGVEIIDEEQFLDKGVYTYAFEDRKEGDYDLNDVVIKAQRQDATHVKFSLEATGAWDELYLKAENGLSLGQLQDKEVHALFKVPVNQFVNTEKDAKHVEPIQDVVEVPANFSFASTGKKLYIHNQTQGYDVKLAEKGQDPHGILIPYDWKYPLERLRVNKAYLEFNNWGVDRVANTDWYKHPAEVVEDHVYMQSVFK